MKAPRWVLTLAGALFVAAYFLWSAWGGLFAYFTTDDLLNLYGYWALPAWRHILDNVNYYSPSYRPLGAAFYLPLYSFFGFNPLPFHLVCFGLILANLALLGTLSMQLKHSRETAIVIVLVGSYHPAFVYLYYNIGTVYDLLCFFFYFATLSYYVYIRQQGRFPSWRETATLILLHIAALNSKEMAVTIPLGVLTFELVSLGARKALSRSLCRDVVSRGKTAFWLALATVPYVFGKLSDGSAFSAHPGYIPEVSVTRYLANYGAYLEQLFYADGMFTPTRVAILLVLLLSVAILSRQRHLQLAWALLTITFLPIAFIDVRGAYAFYIPFAGWTIYAGSLVCAAFHCLSRLVRPLSRGLRLPISEFGLRPGLRLAVILLTTGVLLARAHRVHRGWIVSRQVMNWPGIEMQDAVQVAAEQIPVTIPSMTKGAKVLFLNDPFREYDLTLTFLLRLLYGDPSVQVDRAKLMNPQPQACDYGSYDHVLVFEGRTVRAVFTHGAPPSPANMVIK